MTAESISSYQFGRFTLDLERGALRDGDRDLPLRPKSFEVLKVLLENRGKLVPKEAILRRVWGDAVVTDDSLTQCLIDIRRALGDAEKSIVRTIHRRGYILDADVSTFASREAARGSRPARLPRFAGLAVGLVIVLAISALAWFSAAFDEPEPAQIAIAGSAPDNSIAVLPFVDLSDSQTLLYFGDSLSEEVINVLSQLPELHVVARTSSFSFRGEQADARTIAQRLNVRYILEGSVRASEDNVRIIAQFIDTAEDKHLWSRSFDAALRRNIDVQSEIAFAVASALQVEMGIVVPLERTTDPTTYNLFGHAREIINGRDLSQLPVAIELLREALERDPSFVRGITELARALYQQRLTDQVTWEEAIESSAIETQRAHDLAPDDAVINAFIGWREFLHARDYAEAARRYRRAIAVDPRNLDIIRGLTVFLLTIGRLEDATLLSDYLVAHNPLCLICQRFRIFVYIADHRYEEAELHLRSLISLHPEFPDLSVFLADTLILQGRYAEALTEMDRVELDFGDAERVRAVANFRLGRINEYEKHLSALLNDDRRRSNWVIAMTYAATDNADAALRWLLVEDRTGNIVDAPFRHPSTNLLRNHPRWSEYLEKFGIPTQQEFDALSIPIDFPY